MSQSQSTERKFELRDPVTPYVCSTPDDFHEERDWLTQYIFPRLAEMCKARGTYLAPVDIRWSEDDPVAQEGHLLHSLLDLIKKSAPYFLCLLGERYGPYCGGTRVGIGTDSMERSEEWLELNLKIAAQCGHQWVTQSGHEQCSIPELEIMAATLRGNSHQCTFYFRQAEHLDMKLKKATHDERLDLSARFLTESEHAGLKVQGLKQTIVNRGLPVRYFRTAQQLGKMVIKDWFAILDTVCPPLKDNGQFLDTAHYQQWIAREALLVRLRSKFVESQVTDSMVEHLNEFALSAIDEQPFKPEEDQEDSENGKEFRIAASILNAKHKTSKPLSYQPIMVVNGESGVGKSAGLAYWLQEFAQENPGIFLIHHFIGAAPGDNDIAAFLRRCTRDLRKHFLLTEVTGPAELDYSSSWWSEEDTDTPSDFTTLCQAFIAALALGPSILLLDGINNLCGSSGLSQQEVKEFDWLPVSLPCHSRIILSTSRADLTFRSLYRRGDVKFLTVGGLEDENLKMSHLKTSLKHHVLPLVKAKWKQVREMHMLTSPLALCMLGTELNEHSVNTRLDDYLQKHEDTSALHTFFTQTIKDWVTQFSWSHDDDSSTASKDDGLFDYTGWVADALCLLAMSRGGLCQDEVLQLLSVMGYTGPMEVTVLQWLRFRLRAGRLLWETADGRIRFAHQPLQAITEYSLLKVLSSSEDVETVNKAPQLVGKRRMHMQLALHFGAQPLSWRQAQELPWHLTMAGDMTELLAYVTNNSVVNLFLARRKDYPDGHFDLRYYWSVLEKAGHKPGPHYLRMLSSMGLNVLPSAGSQRSEQSTLLSVGSWRKGQVGTTLDDNDEDEGTEHADSQRLTSLGSRRSPSPVMDEQGLTTAKMPPGKIDRPLPQRDRARRSVDRKLAVTVVMPEPSDLVVVGESETESYEEQCQLRRRSRGSIATSSTAPPNHKMSSLSKQSQTSEEVPSRKPSMFPSRKMTMSPAKIREVLMASMPQEHSSHMDEVTVRRPASSYQLPGQYRKEVPENESPSRGKNVFIASKREAFSKKSVSALKIATRQADQHKKSTEEPDRSKLTAQKTNQQSRYRQGSGACISGPKQGFGTVRSKTTLQQGEGFSASNADRKPRHPRERGKVLVRTPSKMKSPVIQIKYKEDEDDPDEVEVSQELQTSYPHHFPRRACSAPTVRGSSSNHAHPSILRKPDRDSVSRPISAGSKLRFSTLLEAKQNISRSSSAPHGITNKSTDMKSLSNSIRFEFFLSSDERTIYTQDLLDGVAKVNKKHVVAELSWWVGRFLQELQQVQDARTILTCLQAHLLASYPLSRPTRLLLIRVLERLGTICYAAKDLSSALIHYHQALRMAFDLDYREELHGDHRHVETLRGVLLGHHGYMRLLEGDMQEAGTLLKEAAETISELTGNHVLRAAIHFHEGLYRGQLGELARSKSSLKQCLALRQQWHGHEHPEVATTLLALARVNNILNGIKYDYDQRQETKKLYRKALAVSENCLGRTHLQVAEILAELGELWAEEGGRYAKMEARRLLQRTLDIRTTALGTDDCSTKAARASLRRVELALQPGFPDPGLLARPEHSQHISLMPQREMRRPLMASRAGSRSCTSPTNQFGGLEIRAMSREKVLLHNRPDSLMSLERLLASRPMSSQRASAASSALGGPMRMAWAIKTAPLGVREDLDEEESEKRSEGGEDAGMGGAQTSTPRGVGLRGTRDKPRTVVMDLGLEEEEEQEEQEQERARQEQRNAALILKETVEENLEESDTPHLDTFAPHLQDGTIIIGDEPAGSKPKKKVQVRPQSTPHNLFQHYASIADGSQDPPKPRPRSQRSLGQGPRSWSAHTTASSVASHVSRCLVPGPHDVVPHNDASSLTGPNAGIASLLGPPVCPRQNVYPEVHHRSAFYHVPGRYSTAIQYYPPRRSQKTDGARILENVMTTKLQVASRHQASHGTTPRRFSSPHPVGINQRDVTAMVKRTGVNSMKSQGRAILESAKGEFSPDMPKGFGYSAVEFSEPISVS
ncbi:uncharacterized protein [Littorina saxatilis]|uniref:uncharacterized protein n=1 Tax=Littorina saxatilis TaxID=31220 RepID=UPI0038B65973